MQQINHTLKQTNSKLREHKYEFLAYNSAYLLKENLEEDVAPSFEETVPTNASTYDANVQRSNKGEIY